MSEAYETFVHNGKTIEIHPSEYHDGETPRDWFNVGVMICEHRNYNLGDTDDTADEAKAMLEHLASVGHITQFPNWARKRLGATVMFALGLYDHSGISMYTVGRNLIEDPKQRIDGSHTFDPGGWDSGIVGFIFDTAAGREEAGTPPELVEQCLRDEVKLYDQHLTGDVWGYVIDPEDEHESCWGFYGIEDARRNARVAAGYTCKHCEKPLHTNLGNIVDTRPDTEGPAWTHSGCETCGRDIAWGGDGHYHVNVAPWDWPLGKPDHEAKPAQRYHCEDGQHVGETDQKVEVQTS